MVCRGGAGGRKLTEVVLVGGGTRMAAVPRLLRALTGPVAPPPPFRPAIPPAAWTLCMLQSLRTSGTGLSLESSLEVKVGVDSHTDIH